MIISLNIQLRVSEYPAELRELIRNLAIYRRINSTMKAIAIYKCNTQLHMEMKRNPAIHDITSRYAVPTIGNSTQKCTYERGGGVSIDSRKLTTRHR